MLVVKRTHRVLSLVIALLVAVTMMPMLQGTGAAHAAAAQPQAERIELVNAPEGKEFYLGLDDDAFWHPVIVRIIFRNGSERMVGANEYIDIDENSDIYAETKIEYNANEQGRNRLQKGNNIVTITYQETMYNKATRKYEILQTLKKSFTVKGVIFGGYNPSLENNKNISSQISQWGNQILFENGQLWKAPYESSRYEKKEGIKGIVTNVYNSIYLDSKNDLTVENLAGEVHGTIDNVKKFGRGYALQNDGTLQYVPYWSDDRYHSIYYSQESRQKIDIIAENIQHCITAGDYDGETYYAIDKEGRAYCYQYEGYDKDIEKRPIETTEKVTDIVAADGNGAYYLTDSNTLKRFDLDANKSKQVISGVKRILDDFVIGADGKTYNLEGEKLLDTEAVASKNGCMAE